jgi:hypothetical protein
MMTTVSRERVLKTAEIEPSAVRYQVKIIGIVDTDDFRDTVLQQRDRIADRDDAPPAAAHRSHRHGSRPPRNRHRDPRPPPPHRRHPRP